MPSSKSIEHNEETTGTEVGLSRSDNLSSTSEPQKAGGSPKNIRH